MTPKTTIKAAMAYISPADASVWGTIRLSPGSVVRIEPGANPPETTLTEIYNVPMPGYGPRGGDI